VNRAAKLKAIAALELRAKQFRPREDVWPFRVPHEPLAFDPADLQPRTILRMEWPSSAWTLMAIALPSGILLYCDSDGHESRILASVKRGSPAEADGFFLARLAESRGRACGIEMAGPPPDLVRSAIADRDFLTDIFVELFEGTPGQSVLGARWAVLRAGCSVLDAGCSVPGARGQVPGGETEARTGPADFRDEVSRWLTAVLAAPPPAGRQPRLADAQPR
jgi:hypothetical protein